MTAVKVGACGSAVRLDFGDGFVTVGLTDSITPFGQSKTILDTPDLTCATSAQVGREEQSTMVFTHYWDPQDADHSLIEENFEDSLTDTALRDIQAQLVSPEYMTNVISADSEAVTWEATVQIASIAPEELTPEGFYKRTITLLRTSAITKTIAALPTTTAAPTTTTTA